MNKTTSQIFLGLVMLKLSLLVVSGSIVALMLNDF